MLEEGQVPSDRWGHRRHHDTARWSWVSKVGQRLSSREKWGDRVQLAKKSTFGGRQAGSSGRIQVCRWKPGDPGRQGEDVWGAALPGGGRGLPLQGRSTTAGFSLKKGSHSSSHVCRSCPRVVPGFGLPRIERPLKIPGHILTGLWKMSVHLRPSSVSS